MKLAAAVSLLALTAACSDDAPTRNPDKLWLANEPGTETMVRLVGVEPQPF